MKTSETNMDANVKIVTKHITEKLNELDMPIDDVVLGDFDVIGEYTAKKARTNSSSEYKTDGCFFRPNYERGILATAIVKRYRPQRVLEIGFGRGYWTTCVAKAMHEADIDGEIISIDTSFDKTHIEMMSKLFPHDWLKRIKMMPGRSIDIVPQIEGEFDLVYIDGDHTYNAVKNDWEMIKDRFRQFVIFDDYHLPGAAETPDIHVSRAVDEIGPEYQRELIIMDRELFNEDRHDIREKRYGQVIVKCPTFDEGIEHPYTYDW